MIEHHLSPQPVHQFIKALRGKALEKGIGVPFAPQAIYHFTAVQILFYHLIHGVDVVLTVTVYGNGDVAPVLCFHQSGQHRVLVAPVAALGNTHKMAVFPGQLLNNLPGFVLASVVDEQDFAVRADKALSFQLFHFLQEHTAGNGQHLFFVITGDNHI